MPPLAVWSLLITCNVREANEAITSGLYRDVEDAMLIQASVDAGGFVAAKLALAATDS